MLHPIRCCFGASLIVCLASTLASGQLLRAERSSVARELEAAETAAVLDLAPAFLEILQKGGEGFEDTNLPKERVDNAGLDEFVEQFGRLPNDMPTFQVDRDQYFILIPLSELDKSPRGARDEAEQQRTLPDSDTSPSLVVDHRSGQSPVVNQGSRGTCVAFAACAELEAIMRRESRTPDDLCENLAYYWFMKEEQSTPCNDPGLATYKAAEYLQRHFVCAEEHWPYVNLDPSDPMVMCDLVNVPLPAVADKDGIGIDTFLHLPRGTEVTPDGTIDIRDTATLERLLQDGHDIVFGTVLAWRRADMAGIIDVRLGPSGQPLFGAGGHAMLIVGFQRAADGTDDQPYFIVKNSWGDDLGHEGYLYITYDYIRTYAKYGYTTTRINTGSVSLGP